MCWLLVLHTTPHPRPGSDLLRHGWHYHVPVPCGFVPVCRTRARPPSGRAARHKECTAWA